MKGEEELLCREKWRKAKGTVCTKLQHHEETWKVYGIWRDPVNNMVQSQASKGRLKPEAKSFTGLQPKEERHHYYLLRRYTLIFAPSPNNLVLLLS